MVTFWKHFNQLVGSLAQALLELDRSYEQVSQGGIHSKL